MTSPLPVTQATLDAAVEAGARFAYERACSTAAAPEQMVTWDRLSDHMRRYYLIQYGPVVAAVAPIIAAAERERCVGILSWGVESQHLSDTAKKWLRYARSTVQADASHRDSVAAIARAGTSGATG